MRARSWQKSSADGPTSGLQRHSLQIASPERQMVRSHLDMRPAADLDLIEGECNCQTFSTPSKQLHSTGRTGGTCFSQIHTKGLCWSPTHFYMAHLNISSLLSYSRSLSKLAASCPSSQGQKCACPSAGKKAPASLRLTLRLLSDAVLVVARMASPVPLGLAWHCFQPSCTLSLLCLVALSQGGVHFPVCIMCSTVAISDANTSSAMGS